MCGWVRSLATLYLSLAALRDAEDGFWQLKIGGPWQRREAPVLDKLDLLLRGVMIRHSKQQCVLATGRSILELPSITTRLVGLEPRPSEAAICAFLEALSSKLLRHSRMLEEEEAAEAEEAAATVAASTATASIAWNENDEDNSYQETAQRRQQAAAAVAQRRRRRRRQRRGGGMIEQLLKLQRQACSSAMLIAGGAGCRHCLRDIDNLLRRVLALGSGQQGGAANIATGAGGAGRVGEEMLVQPINKALEALLQGQQRQQLRQNTDFAWTSNQTLNMYHTGGWRATMTAVERRDEALVRLGQPQQRLAAEQHLAAWRRWRWAVEMVSSGRGLSLRLLLGDVGGANPVVTCLEALPLGILRKVVAARRLSREWEAAQAAVVAAEGRVMAMSPGELAAVSHRVKSQRERKGGRGGRDRQTERERERESERGARPCYEVRTSVLAVCL